MDKDVLSHVLRRLKFTAQLPDDVQARLAASATVHRYAAKSTVFREKADNHQLMIIWVGKVALDMQVPGREAVRILTAGPGDVIGWSALLGGGKMTTSATALEDTQVIAFAANELQATCESNHSFGYFLMNKVATSLVERLLDTRLKLIDLFTFEQAIGIHPTSRK